MIHVREIVIKASISQDNSAGAQTSASTQSGNASSGNDQVVNICVEKVLEILRIKNQR